MGDKDIFYTHKRRAWKEKKKQAIMQPIWNYTYLYKCSTMSTTRKHNWSINMSRNNLFSTQNTLLFFDPGISKYLLG